MPIHLNRLHFREIALGICLMLLGVVLTKSCEKYERWRETQDVDRREPEKVLTDAEMKRHRLTESDLAAAVEEYKGIDALLDTLEKNQLLDKNGKRRLQALAHAGLSRSYADWATLRIRRGLSPRDYSNNAQVFALKAVTTAPEMPEAEIALAYTYDSTEAEKPIPSATQAKIKELLAKGIDTLDVQYLAWRSGANEKALSFPNELHADSTSDLRILLDVALHFADEASRATAADKQKLIDRSEEFLIRADSVSQNNPLTLFVKGYLSATKEQVVDARMYYQKALDQETAFPKARHNLGFTYALDGEFDKARKEFEAAVRTEGAPTGGLRIWLDSLGEAWLELGDNTKACQAWEQAAGLPDGNGDPMSFLRRAMCAYTDGHNDVAIAEFGRSVQAGKKYGLDPADPSWSDAQHAGPKVREIIKALNQMPK